MKMEWTTRSKVWSSILIITVLAISCLIFWHARSQAECRRSNAELDARIDRIKASQSLHPGTPKSEVIRYLSANQFKISPSEGEVIGFLILSGVCPPFGCGDELTIRIRVYLDTVGNVTGAPEVDGMYTDCM